MRNIKKGIHKHYKGNIYYVHGLCKHSETLEEMVIYQEWYGDMNMWTRPSAMFLEDVLVDGKMIPRFKWVDYLNGLNDVVNNNL